jgi:succinoglycan biosynthesis transport protein ExoP
MSSNQVILPIVALLWRKKLSLLVIFFVANVGVWFAFLAVKPVYESSALILVDSDRALDLDRKPNEGLNREDQFLYSQALIVQSESVVRSAVQEFGPEKLYPPRHSGQFSGLLSRVVSAPVRDISWVDSAYIQAWKAITVRPEPKTDMLRISYRNQNPETTAAFLNTLVQKYIGRHVELTSKPNAISFMEMHKGLAEEEFAKASAALAEFSQAEQIYSADEQQRLLLLRHSELQSALASTTGRIGEKEAQIGEISRQLVNMKLQDVSPQISALIRDTRKLRTDAAPETRAGKDPATIFTASEPPLLLVRVYQDTLESLVRTNSEFSGLRDLVGHQQKELTSIEEKLANISSKRAQFEHLKRNVDLARVSADSFARRSVEQQVDLSLNLQKFLRLQVVQEATVAINPVFPTRTLIISSGVTSGLIADFVYAVALLSFLGGAVQLDVRGPRSRTLALKDVEVSAS